jgi:NitT/TauT family transport system substrate-binding protein
MHIGFTSCARLLRLAVPAVLASVLVGAVAGCGGGGGGDSASAAGSGGGNGIKGQRFTMMVQNSPTPNKVVEMHAIELLKQQGVNASIKYNPSTPNVAISQLLSGDIDVYGEAVSGGIGSALQGIPVVDFALMQPREDYVFLGRKGITRLADLRGKKIGVADTTGITYAQALLVLQKAGLTAKDVHIIAVGGQDVRLPALVSGRVDATMMGHSAQIALKGKGYTTLFDYTSQAANLYDDNAFATKQWLAKHEALAVAFNKAVLDSFKWFNDPANADAVAQEAVKNVPGSDLAQTKELFDQLRKAGAFPDGSVLSTSVLDSEQKLFKSVGAIEGTLPVSQWVNTSYAEQAKGGA